MLNLLYRAFSTSSNRVMARAIAVVAGMLRATRSSGTILDPVSQSIVLGIKGLGEPAIGQVPLCDDLVRVLEPRWRGIIPPQGSSCAFVHSELIQGNPPNLEC